MSTTTLTLDLGLLGELDCDIDFDYTAGQRGCMYLSNGDPGYPPEPDEITINSVTYGPYDFTKLCDMEIIEEQLLDGVRDLAREAIEEAQEARWEARREDEMYA